MMQTFIVLFSYHAQCIAMVTSKTSHRRKGTWLRVISLRFISTLMEVTNTQARDCTQEREQPGNMARKAPLVTICNVDQSGLGQGCVFIRLRFSVLNHLTGVMTAGPECDGGDLVYKHLSSQCWRAQLFIINSAWYFPQDLSERSSFLETCPWWLVT